MIASAKTVVIVAVTGTGIETIEETCEATHVEAASVDPGMDAMVDTISRKVTGVSIMTIRDGPPISMASSSNTATSSSNGIFNFNSPLPNNRSHQASRTRLLQFLGLLYPRNMRHLTLSITESPGMSQ